MFVTRCTCPHCASKLKTARPQEVGKVIRCPKCGRRFAVAEDADEVEPTAISTPAPLPPKMHARSQRPRRVNRWAPAVGLSVGILALLLVGGLWALRSRHAGQPPVPSTQTTGSGEAGTPPLQEPLPSEELWGGGDEVGSLLIGSGYGAGQGPGITVVSGGGVRLYLNGELLAQETEGGQATFVPLTFLPGKNVVAVVASKGTAAPGVLVQIDELEKPYVSGPGWKVSADPGPDWEDQGFDDGGWEDAAVTGARAGTVNGRPETAAMERSAQWIWSPRPADAVVALRLTLTIRAEGFAEKVTGGAGGEVVVATTTAEIAKQLERPEPLVLLIPEGVHDFREKKTVLAAANPNDPNDPSKGVHLRIPVGPEQFGRDPGAKMVETDVWDRRTVLMNGDKTILGMGRGAHLRGLSVILAGTGNMIFRNLCIYDVNPHVIEAGDGLSGNNVEGLWVDHCTFRWISDGCDVGGDRGSKGVTFSWVHYHGANEWTIAGRHHFAAAVGESEVTYHRMWWESVNGRAPKVGGSRSRVHVYNNFYTDNTYHEVAVSDGAQVLLEGCVFDGVRFPTMRGSGGLIGTRDNVYGKITGGHQLDGKTVPEPKDTVFTPPYRYTLEPADAVPALLRSRARVGGKWGQPPAY